jgi:hypothetical protein
VVTIVSEHRAYDGTQQRLPSLCQQDALQQCLLLTGRVAVHLEARLPRVEGVCFGWTSSSHDVEWQELRQR